MEPHDGEQQTSGHLLLPANNTSRLDGETFSSPLPAANIGENKQQSTLSDNKDLDEQEDDDDDDCEYEEEDEEDEDEEDEEDDDDDGDYRPSSLAPNDDGHVGAKRRDFIRLNKANNNHRGLSKIEDPLKEPVVRQGLNHLKLTSAELITMSVKELNKRLNSCPSNMVIKLKRCRRTLKNRGYAKNCRIKRIAAKHKLEQVNQKLAAENLQLREQNKLFRNQLEELRCSTKFHQHDHHGQVGQFDHINHHRQHQQQQHHDHHQVQAHGDANLCKAAGSQVLVDPSQVICFKPQQQQQHQSCENSKQHPEMTTIDGRQADADLARHGPVARLAPIDNGQFPGQANVGANLRDDLVPGVDLSHDELELNFDFQTFTNGWGTQIS